VLPCQLVQQPIDLYSGSQEPGQGIGNLPTEEVLEPLGGYRPRLSAIVRLPSVGLQLVESAPDAQGCHDGRKD
jgi:hypothetical protein